jgi:hypothetical protein
VEPYRPGAARSAEQSRGAAAALVLAAAWRLPELPNELAPAHCSKALAQVVAAEPRDARALAELV